MHQVCTSGCRSNYSSVVLRDINQTGKRKIVLDRPQGQFFFYCGSQQLRRNTHYMKKMAQGFCPGPGALTNKHPITGFREPWFCVAFAGPTE